MWQLTHFAPLASHRMMMMRGDVVLPGRVLMTRGASLVARMLQFQRMRVMAIGTANSLVVHPALDERSIHVNFVLDLAIGKVRVSLQDFLLKVIAVRITGKEVCIKDSSSAVTRGTGLQLGLRHPRLSISPSRSRNDDPRTRTCHGPTRHASCPARDRLHSSHRSPRRSCDS